MDNQVRDRGNRFTAALAGVSSGDPVVVGQIAGVAQIATNADGNVSVKTDGIYTLTVKAIDGSGNNPIAIGDILYFVSGDTPKISKKNTGVRFGYSLGAVAGGATATIRVKLGA